jgi:hypothetical protein
MEIGVLDLASRIVAQTTSRPGCTIAVRADRARAALYAARRQAAECARRVDGVLSNALRKDTADRLPAALAAIFDLADIVGADVGSLARVAVEAAKGAGPQESAVDAADPDVPTGTLLPAQVCETAPAPEIVDGHPWTKRDEIAQALLIAGRTPEESLAAAAMLLAQRNQLNRLGSDGAPVDVGVLAGADPKVAAWRADREKRREAMPEGKAPPLARDGGPIVGPNGVAQ